MSTRLHLYKALHDKPEHPDILKVLDGTKPLLYLALVCLGAVLIALLLSGCTSEVPEWQIQQMQKECEPHGGLAYIDVRLYNSGVCRDGYKWVRPKVPEK